MSLASAGLPAAKARSRAGSPRNRRRSRNAHSVGVRSALLWIHGAGSGCRGEAWRVCHEYQGTIHLVVTKAILCNHRTSDFIARLRLVYPQIRALFVSDDPPSELADEDCICSQYAWLQKPFQLDTLDDTLGELLDRPKKRTVSSLS